MQQQDENKKQKNLWDDLDDRTILVVLISVFIFIAVAVYLSQVIAEGYINLSIPPDSTIGNIKEKYEIAKIYSEIRQIRSDTSGGLFMLKMAALFITVGGAVGGYLIGQSRANLSRIEFEDRKSVDTAYQTILQELSAESPLLRAAAGAKLGLILKSFPDEWTVSEKRKQQLIDLTKKILATSLSIEKDKSVLKNLTKAVVLHHLVESDSDKKDIRNCVSLDFSNVKASDAYWAKTDFSYADFYCADLEKVSFRHSVLMKTQFRESNLQNAVFIDSDCQSANFTLADLRYSDFSGAKLCKALFDRAKVFGVIISSQTVFADNFDVKVDNSPNGDGRKMISFGEWLDIMKKSYKLS